MLTDLQQQQQQKTNTTNNKTEKGTLVPHEEQANTLGLKIHAELFAQVH